MFARLKSHDTPTAARARILGLGALAALALLATAWTTTPAAAQSHTSCGPRPQILKQLEDRYAEMPTALGLASNGGVVEVLSNATGASWTIIITMPNGTSCLVASGEHWETIPHVAAGQMS